ncbi:DUF6134 family protein [Tenacibaculum aiptasiae]|uniref:DUF6134 family protein n=1 Tax=Tenacibaculum aiptasiae TaxID=426481 RepID=UPI003B58F85F
MKTKIELIIIVLFLASATLYGQEYIYDVKVFGKKIGTVTANRIQEGTKTVYKTSSFSSIRFFGKKEISTFMETVYENDILQRSFYEVKKNKKTREKAVLEYKKDKYFIITDGKETYHDKPIFLSTIMLTYHRPKNNERVFEEVGGFYKTMVKISENKFDLINPNSRHKDTYIYNEEGVLKKCIVRKTLFNFEMILKTEKKQLGKL